MIQVHGKFKFFATDYKSDPTLSQLMDNIQNWVRDKKIAPKSIGVEYLESTGTVIMSIGYRDDESYPVSLQMRKVGKIDANLNFDKNEADVSKAAEGIERIICHELFITESGDLNMIFMSKI